MWRSATSFSPLRSKRAIISPLRPRAKASGFTRIRVLSMDSFAGSRCGSGGGARAPAGSPGAPGARPRGRLGSDRGGGLLVILLGGDGADLGEVVIPCGRAGGAAAPAALRGDARHVGLAVGADRPGLVERARAVRAALLE